MPRIDDARRPYLVFIYTQNPQQPSPGLRIYQLTVPSNYISINLQRLKPFQRSKCLSVGVCCFPEVPAGLLFLSTATDIPLLGESHDAYEQVYTNGQPNEAKFSHELLAGGAAFAGFKAFEDHQRKEGLSHRSSFLPNPPVHTHRFHLFYIPCS
jgi:hypothetical protein